MLRWHAYTVRRCRPSKRQGPDEESTPNGPFVLAQSPDASDSSVPHRRYRFRHGRRELFIRYCNIYCFTLAGAGSGVGRSSASYVSATGCRRLRCVPRATRLRTRWLSRYSSRHGIIRNESYDRRTSLERCGCKRSAIGRVVPNPALHFVFDLAYLPDRTEDKRDTSADRQVGPSSFFLRDPSSAKGRAQNLCASSMTVSQHHVWLSWSRRTRHRLSTMNCLTFFTTTTPTSSQLI